MSKFDSMDRYSKRQEAKRKAKDRRAREIYEHDVLAAMNGGLTVKEIRKKRQQKHGKTVAYYD